MPQPEGYAWPPTGIDQIDRVNTTPARNQHPKDHDDLERAVNAIIYVLGDAPMAADDNVTARLLIMQNLLTGVIQQVAGISGADITEAVRNVIQGLDLANLSISHYVHYQPGSADAWTVNHGLGFDPIVTVVRDSPQQVVDGYDLAYSVDHMSLTLGFSQAITGRAILSN